MKTKNPWLGVVAVKTLRAWQVSFQWSGRRAWLGSDKQSPGVSGKFYQHQKRHFSLPQAHKECAHLMHPYTFISCPLTPHLYTSLTHKLPSHSHTWTSHTYLHIYHIQPHQAHTHTHTQRHSHFTCSELDPLLPCSLSSWVYFFPCGCCSVAKSCLTLQPHKLQHARLPCPSPSPGACSDSCPSSL